MNIKQGWRRANESGARAVWPSIGFPKINAARKENMHELRWNPGARPAESFLGGVEFPDLLKLVFFNSALMREKFAEQAKPSSTLAASHLFTRKDFAILSSNSKPSWRTHELSVSYATQQLFFF